MTLTDEQSKHIKVLARAGNWSEIEELYGKKTVRKARRYLKKKQTIAMEKGEDAANNRNDDEGDDDEDEDETNPSLEELKLAFSMKKSKGASIVAVPGPDSILSPIRSNVNNNDDDDDEEEKSNTPSLTVMNSFSLASVSDMLTTRTDNGLDSTIISPDAADANDVSLLTKVPKLPKKFKAMKLLPKTVSSSSNDISMEMVETTNNDSDDENLFVKKSKKSKTKKSKTFIAPINTTINTSSSTITTNITAKQRVSPLVPNAYVLFSHEARSSLKSEGLSFADSNSRISEMWKELPIESKKVFQDLSDFLKAEAAQAKEGTMDDDNSNITVTSSTKNSNGSSKKKPKKIKRVTDDASDNSSSDNSEPEVSNESKKTKPVSVNGKGASIILATASSVNGKGKGKRGRPRKGSDNEDNDDSEATDEDDIIHYTWEDPRKAAEEKALARKQAGKGARINNGVIELVSSPENMNDSIFSEERCMPHLPCRMDYSSYLFCTNDEVAFILPAYIDWMDEISKGASNSFTDDGTAIGHEKYSTAAQVLSTLTEKHALQLSMQRFYSLTDTGIVHAQVVGMECVGTAMDILSIASNTLDSESEQPRNSAKLARNTEFSPTNGYFTKGDRRYQWYLVTLAIDTPENEEEEEEEIDEEGNTVQSAPLTVTIPWLPPQHPLITSPFLLRSHAYVTAMEDPIKPGTQCRMPLVSADNIMEGEWYEGRVYAVNPRKVDKDNGWIHSSYKSVRVIWYEQDADTKAWYIDILQQECPVSPWELRTKNLPFVTKDNIRIFVETEAPKLISPFEIITYIKTLEAAVYFQSPVPKAEVNYHSRIKNPMDLSTIFQRAQNGVYDEVATTDHYGNDNDDEEETTTASASVSKKLSSIKAKSNVLSVTRRGMDGLWDDLRLIIKNAKVFNQPERAEWRTADMLECELRRIKSASKNYSGASNTGNTLVTSTTLSSSSSSSSAVNPLMLDDDWDTLNELEND